MNLNTKVLSTPRGRNNKTKKISTRSANNKTEKNLLLSIINLLLFEEPQAPTTKMC